MGTLSTNWMGITFPTPVILASLTPFSHCEARQHADYLARAIEFGAGGIILPSINLHKSLNDNTTDVSKMLIEIKKFEAGLSSNDYMGFSLLGKTTNILSLNYIMDLAKALREKTQYNVPILASVANNGSEEDFLATIDSLIDSALFDGLELNFSCPNIQNSEKKINDTANHLNAITIQKIITSVENYPVSIKLKPNISEPTLQWLTSLMPDNWGLTISNAYVGLEPPSSKAPFDSPYNSFDKWSPAGLYGPFERLLTFHDLYRIVAHTQRHNLVSSVGGYVTGEHIIQAILLGACTIQLSSAIAWSGIKSFRDISQNLHAYLSLHDVDSIDDIRGLSLDKIRANVDDTNIRKFDTTMNISTEKCNPPCNECNCVDRLCIAISQKHEGVLPTIDRNMCSGCGWCVQMCRKQAISSE